MKHKGLLDVTYECIAHALMFPSNIRIDTIINDDSKDIITLKLSADNKACYENANFNIVDVVQEGEEFRCQYTITTDMMRILLAQKLIDLSSGLNNTEFVSIVETIVDARPNLREYVAERLSKEPDERGRFV